MKFIPNLLTLSRFPFTIIIFLILPSSPKITLTLFVLAALTDFLDGAIARRWKTQSRFGEKIDPLADKFFYLGTLFALWWHGAVPEAIWPLIFILPSETALTLIRIPLVRKLCGRFLNKTVSATLAGKIKMASQMGALTLMLAGVVLVPEHWLKFRNYLAQLGFDISLFAVLFSYASLKSHLFLKKLH